MEKKVEVHKALFVLELKKKCKRCEVNEFEE